MSQSNSISVHRKMNQTGDFTSVENSTSFLYPTFGHDDWNNNSEWKSKRNKVKEGAICIHEIIYFLKTFTVFFTVDDDDILLQASKKTTCSTYFERDQRVGILEIFQKSFHHLFHWRRPLRPLAKRRKKSLKLLETFTL